ncbi:hypothetical protein LOD99_4681 [Oopsacas minuta]|uniref:Mesencephalic astrocyte-derived neurotrophic factor homolog n=1 Tax=Oopsacas minuta TaxID=111878 RepID=A0AAV7JV90_9METZ|nr:hypothetical protein LOD99_4681 [Oopsacas minuta]
MLLARFSLLSLLLISCSVCLCKLKEGDCEVCIKFLEAIEQESSDQAIIGENNLETYLRDKCSTAIGKEGRFCYYIGATEDAATGIVNEVVKPMASTVPAVKICEKLKKMDEQICELKYDKKIDFKNTDISKLRVRELKKILSEWGENCLGCAEKSDYVKRVKELLPKHEEL